MSDSDLPGDWVALHEAAWAAGWSIDGASAGYRAGWTYTATTHDRRQRRAFATASAMRAWAAGGYVGLPAPYYDHHGITIYHGDCQAILPWLTSTGAAVVSDVPYGRVLRSSRNGAHGNCAIANDDDTTVRDAIIAWATERRIPAVIFGSPAVPRPAAITPARVLIWDKGEHVGMGDLTWPWKPNYEEIYILGDGYQGRRTSSVLRYNAIAGTVALAHGRTHPTEKPVGLMQALITKCPGTLIIDPTMGTGATLVAAKNLGRCAIGIELDERYCEQAAQRLAQEVLDFDEAA